MLVLLAESDELVRMVTLDLLEDAGFQTLGVAKVAEAEAALRGGRDVRVLVTGRSVERQDDGVALAQRVRQLWPQIRIIVTSGMGGGIETMLPVGTHLLRKPFAFGDLLDLIEAEPALAGSRASAAPLLPDGLPASPMEAAAAPASEPDKT